MGKGDFNEICTNLAQLYELGVLQLSTYKESKKNDTVKRGGSFTQLEGMWLPHRVVVGKLISDPKTFLFQNIEQYWALYKSALDIFGAPGVQFLMRPIMEMAYSRIVLYSQKPVSEQKDIALKFWIYINGILIKESVEAAGDKFGLKDYTALVQLLSSESDKKHFLELQKKEYPFHILQRELYELFPSLFSQTSEEQLVEALADLWNEEQLKKYQIGRQVRLISMLVHGNPVAVRFLQGGEDYTHVLRCAKVLQFTGITVLKLTEKGLKIPVHDQLTFKQLERDFGAYLLKLWKERGALT